MVEQGPPIRRRTVAAWAAVLSLALAAPAAAQTFGAPTMLSQYLSARAPSVAVDGQGNFVATWFDMPDPYRAGIYMRTRAPGGSWSAIQPLTFVTSAPQIHSSAAGVTTAVWAGAGGTMAADRAAGGTWSAPLLIAPGLTFTSFEMNANGDAVVGAQTGPWYQGSTVWAARRSGGAWGAALTVGAGGGTSGSNSVRFDALAIGAGGDALLVWESFQRTCVPRACRSSNYQMHVARGSGAAGSAWLDSGVIGPTGNLIPFYAIGVMDGAGRAALLYGASNPPGGDYGNAIWIAQQGHAGGRWQAPYVAYVADASKGPYVGEAPAGASADAHGNVALVFNESINSFPSILAIDGNLRTHVWGTAPVNLAAGGDGPGPMIFRGNGAGGGIVEWTDLGYGVHVNTRASFRQPWSARQDVVQQIAFCGVMAPLCSTLGGTDINTSGAAAVSYQVVDTAYYDIYGGLVVDTSALAAVQDR